MVDIFRLQDEHPTMPRTRPRKKTEQGGEDGHVDMTNILVDKVRSLINTITARSYKHVVTELVKLPMAESYDLRLATVVEIVEAALLNSMYHVLYVKLFVSLSSDPTYSFDSVVVQEIQSYFDYLKNECVLAYGTRSEPVTPLEEDVFMKKQHFLTFNQFLVLLYENYVVPSAFILDWCKKLLPGSNNIGQIDQLKLECLCVLLRSYVKTNKNVLPHLNTVGTYFKRLRKLCEKKATSAKIRTLMWEAVVYYEAAAAAATAKQLKIKNPQQVTTTSSTSVQDLPKSLSAVTLGSPPKICSVVNYKQPASTNSTSSCTSFHSVDETSSQEGSVKSWAIPLVPVVLKLENSTAFEKLVEVYEMRLRNHRCLQALDGKSLVKDCGLIKPNFVYLQWMRINASSTLADTSASLSTAVEKFLNEAEHSLKEHMRAYHKTVEEAAGEKINELVEGLPANSRAEMNRKAYDTAVAKIQS